ESQQFDWNGCYFVEIDAIQEQHVVVDIQVECGPKPLDQRHRAGVVLVEEGPADIFDIFLGNNPDGPVGYTVDINSSNILIDFYITQGSTTFSSTRTVIGSPIPEINGLYISGSQFDANAFIGSAEILQNNFLFSQDRIIYFDDNSIGLDFESLVFQGASQLTISFAMPSVPIPPALYLFGSGLIGLIGLARCKAM
ncbi:hypothetical protein MNBD_GAMMA15-763, partial [hydrothermal vent metagenome]